MKKPVHSLLFIVILTTLFCRCNPAGSKASAETISFYDVPLVCGADKSIGCGSRIKPLFLESQKHKEIKESWTNRQGTVIAFVWANEMQDDKLAKNLFNQFDVDATLITDKRETIKLTAGLQSKQNWYQGMAVDSLSLHEAGTIARNSTQVIVEAGLISADEATIIRPEIENYFRKELVKVRTFDELINDQRSIWLEESYKIYANHLGYDRADIVKTYYAAYVAKKEAYEANCKESCRERKDCCTKK